MTCVDRSTRCILGFGVVWRRDGEAMQQVVDDAPPAKHYFSDGFPTYAQLLCIRERTRWQRARARRIVSRETTPRCVIIWRGLAAGERQKFKRAFPKTPAHVCDFVADLI